MKLHAVLVLSAVLLIAADAKEDVAKEIKKLEGAWIVERFETNGKEIKKPIGQEFSFTADKMGIKNPEGKLEEVGYSLDPSKKPKTIDLTMGGMTITGIYELDGDSLKICFAARDEKRSAEFATKEDNGNRFFILKRQKK